MAGFSSVEAKDELVEVGLQMFAAQPVVDAARPALEVGEDLVDPGEDEMSGGLAEDMDVVAIRRNADVAGPAVGPWRRRRDRRRFRRSGRGWQRRRRRFRPAAGGPGWFHPPVRWRR